MASRVHYSIRSAESRAGSPDVANLRPVLQGPAVGDLVLPAHVARVLPQQTHLVASVASVPQGVPQVLARTRL